MKKGGSESATRDLERSREAQPKGSKNIRPKGKENNGEEMKGGLTLSNFSIRLR